MRATKDELHLSAAALQLNAMQSGEWDTPGRLKYQERGDAKTAVHPVVKETCLPAYTLNEHDSSPNAAFVYGGASPSCNVWLSNTCILIGVAACAALFAGLVYLVCGGWVHILNGLRELSFW